MKPIKSKTEKRLYMKFYMRTRRKKLKANSRNANLKRNQKEYENKNNKKVYKVFWQSGQNKK